MNLTLGFIAFFVSIVIPGILFRRFFYYGEFSKQFNTKDPVLHSIFFSIIPGILLQLLGFFLYYLILDFDSSFFDVFTIFRDVTSDGTNDTQKATVDFINNEIITFFYYSLFVFGLSAFLGYVSSRLIRWRKWDKKYKLFRFRNQWYYIFSGEVLNMKKFKDAHRVTYNKEDLFKHDVSTTYADILVSINEDKRELYTGYVVDYDLKSDDISQLDKIYLIDTYRYKKKEALTEDKSKDLVLDEEKIEHETKKDDSSRGQKQIPGDVFILKADNIININLTFIPSKKKEEEKKEKEQVFFGKIRMTYFVIIVLIILLHIFYKTIGLNDTFFESYINSTNIFTRILTILFINQILSFAIPYENKKGELCYDFSDIGYRIFSAIFWGALTFFFVIKPLI